MKKWINKKLYPIRNYLLRFIIRRMYYYGVQFESSLPPEFMVSTHAEQRIWERIGTKDKQKIERLVTKAWFSNEKIPKMEIKENINKYVGRKYKFRSVMGKVFIFAYAEQRGCLHPVKLLVTVI